jgi:hypothetical protein
MKSVDYEFWAGYIKEIHQTLGSSTDTALELGSGNGKLSGFLKNEFKRLYLTDISLEMLQKSSSNFSRVCCDMIRLPFKRKFDFIFSAFDSVNYIADDENMILFLKGISEYLTDNGHFTFDVSLKKNSLKHLKKLNRKGKYKGLEYIQRSEFDERTMIHKNLLKIKTPEGKVFKEIHIQKIYDFYYYFDILEKSGLYVTECFDAFDFKDGSPDSDRLQFIVKRKS